MNSNRHQDWELPKLMTWDKVHIAVLMDIRDELYKLNRILHCPNFLAIPNELRLIKNKLPVKKKPHKSVKRKSK